MQKVIFLREELNKKCLLEYEVELENKIRNKRLRIDDIGEDEQISIVSDAMFKTMLNNEKRIKFPCKLLSCLLDISYEELLSNLKLTKNEFDKDSVTSKGERGDFLAKIGENYLSIEMNVRNDLGRNIEYLDRVSRSRVKIGSEYIYPSTIQINLNNFSFKEHNEPIEIYKLQNEKGEMLTFRVFVQIYIPKLLEKRYNKGIQSLSELEKCILVMVETNRKNVKELALGDEILEEYMEEAKMVEENDNYLREAYDHRQAEIEVEKEEAFEKGKEQGAEQRDKELIQSMFQNGITVDDIQKITKLSIEKINQILENK